MFFSTRRKAGRERVFLKRATARFEEVASLSDRKSFGHSVTVFPALRGFDSRLSRGLGWLRDFFFSVPSLTPRAAVFGTCGGRAWKLRAVR
jgi:hypothetical protein